MDKQLIKNTSDFRLWSEKNFIRNGNDYMNKYSYVYYNEIQVVGIYTLQNEKIMTREKFNKINIKIENKLRKKAFEIYKEKSETDEDIEESLYNRATFHLGAMMYMIELVKELEI